jgi:hypothetical protein
LELARSTMWGWHAELAQLVRPLVDAMWKDALASPYLCTDATASWCKRKSGAAWATSGCSSRPIGTYAIAILPGATRKPSMHTFAAALDVNPEENPLIVGIVREWSPGARCRFRVILR